VLRLLISKYFKHFSISLSLFTILSGCTLKTDTVLEDANEIGNTCPEQITAWRSLSTDNVIERYKDLNMIDVHNHDANVYETTMRLWDENYIDKVAISGHVSRESSLLTDELAWKAYSEHPTRLYPFFSGIDIFSDSGLSLAHQNLEQGFMGIGEIAAQSFHSPILSTAEWKADHPMDGNLSKIYEMAAEYKVPVLLHIDPPTGTGIEQLEEALTAFPNTKFIFGHMNVANSPDNIEKLMEKYNNLYMDVYAGYTAYNSRDSYQLKDYAGLIEKYSDRVLVSTDSGVEIEYQDAIKAMYELIDELKPETACKVSHENFLQLMEQQPVTKTQLKELLYLSQTLNTDYEEPKTKQAANELIFKLKEQLKETQVTYTELPDPSAIATKPLEELNDLEMVSIGRSLLRRLNEGFWSKDAELKAKDEWDKYYSSNYFSDALSEDNQISYENYPELNSFEYRKPSFEKEAVKKEEAVFVFNAEMKELLVKNSEETPYITLYRVWIGFNQETKTYKVKKIIGVDIKR
jgi:predicted TIM-barrel fold metal-dependent hydrolase